MKIHIVSTINGEENEGMRNIATHLGREFEKTHTVIYSALRDLFGIIRRSYSCDVTFVIARAVGKVYRICQVAQIFAERLCVVLVQKPEDEFVRRCKARPLCCDYFALVRADAEELPIHLGCRVFDLSLGIDAKKFSPVDQVRASQLKEKYGFDAKPVILHVGHLSSGRGLEDFLLLNSTKYNLLVVTSGMFEDKQIEKMLISHGVRLIKGYLSAVNELYQLADVYLFPTKSTDFVIDISLSVMEALSCGTAVIAYRSLETLQRAGLADGGGLLFAENADDIPALAKQAVAMKSEKSYLTNPKTWAQVADDVLRAVAKE